MKKHLFTLIAALGCLVATTAHADQNCNQECYVVEEEVCSPCAQGWISGQPCDEGFYVGAIGGVNFLNDIRHTYFKSTFKTGFLVGATAGYQFNYWHVEGEFAYRNNKLDQISDHKGRRFQPDIRVQTYSVMVNGYWDINLNFCVRPYVGAGLGYSWNTVRVHVKKHKASANGNGFAWQAMVGGVYDLTDDVKLSAEYRYFSDKKASEDQSLIFALKYAL
jgi:opacity protein-like surface antigen